MPLTGEEFGPFPLTNFRATCCVTAMRYLAMNFENSCEAWASAKFCLHRAHLGSEPMSNGLLVPFAVSSSIMLSCFMKARYDESYFDYYHRSRTHLSLGKDSP